MVGELKSFRPHHRMSAARELLDRGFGKSARNETPTPVVPAEARTQEHPPVVPAKAGTQRGPGRDALTPHSSPLTPGNPEPVEGPTPTDRHSHETRDLHNPLSLEGEGWGEGENVTPQSPRPPVVPADAGTQMGPDREALTLPNTDDIDDWLDPCDSPLHDFMSECEHPDFDPCLATIDEDYFESFTDCTDPECEVHGDPPDFDPNDYHY